MQNRGKERTGLAPHPQNSKVIPTKQNFAGEVALPERYAKPGSDDRIIDNEATGDHVIALTGFVDSTIHILECNAEQR